MKYPPASTEYVSLLRAAQDYDPGTWEYAEAGMLESLRTSSLGLIYTSGQIMQSKETGNTLTKEQFVQHPDYRDGIKYEEGMTVEYLKLLKDEWERKKREEFLSRNATIGQEFAKFGAGMLFAIPDPANLIPFGAVAKAAGVVKAAKATNMGRKIFGKFGATELRKKALVGAVDGLGGSIMLQPGIMHVKEQLQTDYTMGDASLDVLVSTGAGTLLGAGAHLIGTKLNKHRNSITIDKQVEDAQTASAAFDEDKPVRVNPPTPEQIAVDPYVPDAPFENTITVGDGKQKYKTRLVIRELADVVASHEDDGTMNPDFPPEFQPRQERGSVQMMAEVDADARRLDPTQLGESPLPQYGSPITYQGSVLSGNGRFMKIRRAANEYPEAYANYVKALRDSGYKVDDFQQPVLIRELVVDEGFEPVRFAQESNIDVVSQMTEGEIALRDASLVDDAVARSLTSNDLRATENLNAINRIAQLIFGKTDMNRAFKDGKLTAYGEKRIRNAIFSKAFGDYSLVNNALQSENQVLKKLFSSMEKIAIPLARLRAAADTGRIYPTELFDDLQVALREIYNLANRDTPITVAERLDQLIGPKQGTLFGTEATEIADGFSAKQVRLLQLLDEFKSSPDQAADVIRRIIQRIEEGGDAMQSSFLGKQEPPKLGAIIEEVIGTAIKERRVRSQIDQIKREVADELGIALRKDRPEPLKKNSPEQIAEFETAVNERSSKILNEMELDGPKATEDDISYATRDTEPVQEFEPVTTQPVEETPEQMDFLDQQFESIRDDLKPEERQELQDAEDLELTVEREIQERESLANCILNNSK